MTLSILIITSDSFTILGDAFKSIGDISEELLVGDSGSTDGTIDMAKKYGATVVEQKGLNLDQRKQQLIDQAKGDWVLILDSDEWVSPELKKEILQILRFDKSLLKQSNVKNSLKRARKAVAYRISYQNYVLGKAVYWGGERYSKVRLFRRRYGHVTAVPIHEEVVVDGPVGELHGVIHHHSFRSISQIFRKFTHYALLVAQEKKKKHEVVTFSELFLYGPHMFWARLVKEEGYKDGWRGFILAFAFAYMEALTYWILFFL